MPSLVPSEGIAASRAKGNEAMSRCPGERKFFNILNAELRKAIHFFEKAMQEFAIREERVREGYFILKKPATDKPTPANVQTSKVVRISIL